MVRLINFVKWADEAPIKFSYSSRFLFQVQLRREVERATSTKVKGTFQIADEGPSVFLPKIKVSHSSRVVVGFHLAAVQGSLT